MFLANFVPKCQMSRVHMDLFFKVITVTSVVDLITNWRLDQPLN